MFHLAFLMRWFILQRWSLRPVLLYTMCPHILSLLRLTLTGNTRIISGLDLWPQIITVIPVKLCPSIKRGIVEQFYQGKFFAEQISTLKKGSIPSLVKQIHSRTCALIRVCMHVTVRHTRLVTVCTRHCVMYYILCVWVHCNKTSFLGLSPYKCMAAKMTRMTKVMNREDSRPGMCPC